MKTLMHITVTALAAFTLGALLWHPLKQEPKPGVERPLYTPEELRMQGEREGYRKGFQFAFSVFQQTNTRCGSITINGTCATTIDLTGSIFVSMDEGLTVNGGGNTITGGTFFGFSSLESYEELDRYEREASERRRQLDEKANNAK